MQHIHTSLHFERVNNLSWSTSDAYLWESDQSLCICAFNTFLFMTGISCPYNVETSLTENCLKPTKPGFTYNLLPVSCGDISVFKKSWVWYWPGKQASKRLCWFYGTLTLFTILLSDLARCDSLLQIVWPLVYNNFNNSVDNRFGGRMPLFLFIFHIL